MMINYLHCKRETAKVIEKNAIIIMILSISFYSLGGVKEIFKRKPNINPVTVVKSPLSYSIELHISIILLLQFFFILVVFFRGYNELSI